jgi:tetratricopeptide (TPR) repeat protein
MKKKVLMSGLLISIFLIAPFVGAAEKSCDELIAMSEKQWMTSKFDESDANLDQVITQCPKLSEPFWRKARNIYERQEAVPREQRAGKEELLKQYKELENLADKCIELDEKDGNCWLWKGAAVGRTATTKGILTTLWVAEDVEKPWLKGETLKPVYRASDGSASTLADIYYALGMYYRVVPEWLCLFPLKQIIGTCGDKAKSVEYQRKALKIEPQRIEYHKELGVSLICYGNSHDKPEAVEEGKKLLIGLQSLPVLKDSDKVDKDHAKTLLSDLSIACGYQRDKQQEVSEEAYKKEQEKK